MAKKINKTQNEMIMRHLKKHKAKGITTLEAFNLYGVTRLSARIFELRENGNPISAKLVYVDTRNGRRQVCRYTLAEG